MGTQAASTLHDEGAALLLLLLADEGLVDVGDDTTTRDGGLRRMRKSDKHR